MPSPAVIEELYAAFEVYPLRERLDGCPCCVAAGDQLAIHRVPLRRLVAADLGRYAWKAMTTWGDHHDYRHFLPRILELSLVDRDEPGLELWLVASKLDYAGFASWCDAAVAPGPLQWLPSDFPARSPRIPPAITTSKTSPDPHSAAPASRGSVQSRFAEVLARCSIGTNRPSTLARL